MVSWEDGNKIKREDCKRTKHDTIFSPWKVLIGPCDWKEHSTGKEGAERYRVHNLPNNTSCSGIYELGIVVEKTSSGRVTSKLDKNCIVPAYVGQADNVRNRMQQYGREGDHLERGKSNRQEHDVIHQGPRLFSDIFSRGYSIAFRWAPMKNKSDAEKAEAQLLGAFDYAWNKGSNGVRRPNDVHKKLNKIASESTRFPSIATKFWIFQPMRKGVKIQPCDTDLNSEKTNIFSRIFQIGRSRPRNVSSRFDLYDDASICGVALGNGFVCRKPHIEGRKRCDEHKGMKINGITSKLKREVIFHHDEQIFDLEHKGMKINEITSKLNMEENFHYDEQVSDVEHKEMTINGINSQLKMEENFHYDEQSADVEANVSSVVCDVTLENGMVCNKKPVQGRKRCVEHKGRRITGLRKPAAYGNFDEIYKTHESGMLESAIFTERVIINQIEASCGVNLSDGNFCTNSPVKGRKRCQEHKGMRITVSKF